VLFTAFFTAGRLIALAAVVFALLYRAEPAPETTPATAD